MTASVDPVAFSDPVYREAVVDLLAAVGYGEVSAFERLAEDAKLAPTLEDKLALGMFASQQIGKVELIRARLTELGADPFSAMESFRDGFESFHAHTAPSDLWEGLVKAYVGDGLANDFYREIAAFLDPETRDLVLTSLEDTGQADFAVRRNNFNLYKLPGNPPAHVKSDSNPVPAADAKPDSKMVKAMLQR